MDLRQAELTRSSASATPRAHHAVCCSGASPRCTKPHACALETTLWAEDWSGTVEFLSVVDGDVRNSGWSAIARFPTTTWSPTKPAQLSPDSALLVCQTVQSRIPIAVAARTTAWRGDAPLQADVRFVDEPRRTGHDLLVHLDAGDSVTVEKMAAIFTGRDHAIAEPGDGAARLAGPAGPLRRVARRPHPGVVAPVSGSTSTSTKTRTP